MIPVAQTKLHDPDNGIRGNCMSACLSSILEIPLSDIPKFEDMEKGRWHSALKRWLEGLGFMILEWQGEVDYLEGYYLAAGTSPRGVKHMVVYKKRMLVHDPHPSRDGLIDIDYCWALLPFNPSNHRKDLGL